MDETKKGHPLFEPTPVPSLCSGTIIVITAIRYQSKSSQTGWADDE